ncbi:hypothetical protein HPB48_013030 [Haemaphysalis longicornis]|uniref:Monocarboxylate transporter n=1 Tax=Haemaphysalis longicornis TaxID=44386 RepID=A0A9J6GSV1_HAELO|nr:hypothetical protein HPB48_013030 [Haemaphysalis longicornis]
MKDPDKPATATTYGTVQKSPKNIHSTSIRQFTCEPCDTFSKSDYKNEKTEPVLQSNKSVHMLPPAADLLPPLPNSEQHGSIDGIVRQTLVLLQTPCFYVILISMLACDFTFQIFNSTIVDYARDKGLSLNKGAQLAACSSAGCICGQVLIPFLFDKLTGSRCTPAALSFGVLSACFIIMPCLVDFVATSVLTFVTGIQQGYIRNLKPVLTADYLGTHLVAVSWAVMGLIALPLTFLSLRLWVSRYHCNFLFSSYYDIT